MTSAKERAIEIYLKHMSMASVDGRAFRKTVMDEMQAELQCSVASAATHYNTAKKLHPVEGLGRTPISPGARKIGDKPGPNNAELQPDDECFTVIEVLNNPYSTVSQVGRTQSFLMQGDASECFDMKCEAFPFADWALIQGLGPNSGEAYRIQPDEKEIKYYKKLTSDKIYTQREVVSTTDEDLDDLEN